MTLLLLAALVSAPAHAGKTPVLVSKVSAKTLQATPGKLHDMGSVQVDGKSMQVSCAVDSKGAFGCTMQHGTKGIRQDNVLDAYDDAGPGIVHLTDSRAGTKVDLQIPDVVDLGLDRARSIEPGELGRMPVAK